jgi:hypothetical protein
LPENKPSIQEPEAFTTEDTEDHRGKQVAPQGRIDLVNLPRIHGKPEQVHADDRGSEKPFTFTTDFH